MESLIRYECRESTCRKGKMTEEIMIQLRHLALTQIELLSR